MSLFPFSQRVRQNKWVVAVGSGFGAVGWHWRGTWGIWDTIVSDCLRFHSEGAPWVLEYLGVSSQQLGLSGTVQGIAWLIEDTDPPRSHNDIGWPAGLVGGRVIYVDTLVTCHRSHQMGLVFVGGVKGSQNKGDLKKKAVRLTAPSCRFLGRFRSRLQQWASI